MNKIIDLERKQFKRKFKESWEQFKRKFKESKEKALMWIAEHPVETSTIGSTVALTAIKARKSHKKQKELDDQESRIWDPQQGVFWRCRRRLTNRDKLNIASRRQNGEKLTDILTSMKLI